MLQPFHMVTAIVHIDYLAEKGRKRCGQDECRECRRMNYSTADINGTFCSMPSKTGGLFFLILGIVMDEIGSPFRSRVELQAWLENTISAPKKFRDV